MFIPPPPAFGEEGGHTGWVEMGWGPIVRKTPDTAPYFLEGGEGEGRVDKPSVDFLTSQVAGMAAPDLSYEKCFLIKKRLDKLT